jgi:hypothetical protein
MHARANRQDTVVSVSRAEAVLISDGRAVLVREVSVLRGRSDLLEVFAAWLSSSSGLSVVPAADEASRRVGAQRTYSDVAVLGYAADAGALDDPSVTALTSGLDWIIGRPAFVEGAPTGLGTDGVAALGLALGGRAVGGPLLDRIRDWLGPIAAAACQSGIPLWHRFLFAVSSQVIEGVPKLDTSMDEGMAALRVALSAHGMFQHSSPAAADLDAVSVIAMVKANIGNPLSPTEAAIRLAALTRVAQAAPVVVFGNATIPQVADLLRRIPTAMRRWTWEEKARTRNGTARKWHIDHEYHVQNLLWAVLSPIFPDLKEEESTPSVGQKHPRADLCIPSLRLIIEVKFIRSSAAFASIVEEVAADAALYFGPGSPYEAMLVFLWDASRSVEEHDVFITGVRQLARIVDVVAVLPPGSMV